MLHLRPFAARRWDAAIGRPRLQLEAWLPGRSRSREREFANEDIPGRYCAATSGSTARGFARPERLSAKVGKPNCLGEALARSMMSMPLLLSFAIQGAICW